MGKRKPGAVQFDDDGTHRSKKPRTNSVQPTVGCEEERDQQSHIGATEDAPTERATKQVRTARKRAKRLAKREQRQNETKGDKAQNNETRNDDATIPTTPVEVVDVIAKPKKEPRQRLSDAGTLPKPGRSSKTKHKKRLSNEERLRLKNLRLKTFGPNAIKIMRNPKDNKVVSDNFLGRGDSLQQKPDEWVFSKQFGGRMRDIDPLFSTNEEWVRRLVIGATPLLTGL